MTPTASDPTSPAKAQTLAPDSPLADRVFPSPNHGERRGDARPDMIVLHYTGMPQAHEALQWLANPLSEVSCHYFVFEDGRIWQMVPEQRRAWHAGAAYWQGVRDLNSRSIGIEIANCGHDLTKMPPEPGAYPDFPSAQIEALIALVADIAARWRIPKARLLAHSDIAPGRKVDPGEKFPWDRLAQAGLGLWPDLGPDLGPGFGPGFGSDLAAFNPRGQGSGQQAYTLGAQGVPIRAAQTLFARLGYELAVTGLFDTAMQAVVSAFQRHWHPQAVSGILDLATLARLKAVLDLAEADLAVSTRTGAPPAPKPEPGHGPKADEPHIHEPHHAP